MTEPYKPLTREERDDIRGAAETLQWGRDAEAGEYMLRLLADLDHTETELESAQRLIDRQSSLLTGVANALRGQPPELMLYDHSQLPQLALRVADQFVVRLKAAFRRGMYEARLMLNAKPYDLDVDENYLRSRIERPAQAALTVELKQWDAVQLMMRWARESHEVTELADKIQKILEGVGHGELPDLTTETEEFLTLDAQHAEAFQRRHATWRELMVMAEELRVLVEEKHAVSQADEAPEASSEGVAVRGPEAGDGDPQGHV